MSQTSDNSGPSTSLGPIKLASGITKHNALTAIYAAIAMNCMMAFINVVQPLILTENLNVPIDMQGTVSGNLTFVSELVALLLLGPIGALSDRLGRRPIIAFGFVAMGAGYLLYPLMPSVQTLFLGRAVFAIGVASIAGMMTTILNDYPKEESRGKMMALGGVSNGVGGLFMVLVLARLPLWLQESMSVEAATLTTFVISALLCLITAGVLFWGLNPMRNAAREQQQDLIKSFKQGLLAAKKPRVALAYCAAFVARSDLVVIGTFFLLWCVQSGIEAGMTSAEATARSGLLFAVMQASALLSAPLIGILVDKVDRVLALSICMIIVAIGYFGLGLIENPLSLPTVFVSVLIGSGMMAGMLSSQALIGESAEPQIRGAVIGVFGLSGAVGILFITSVGGVIYDGWARTGPFLMIAAMALILAVVAFILHRKSPTTPQRTNSTDAIVITKEG